MSRSGPPTFARRALAFLMAVALAVAWGAIVQTQINLASLAALGAPVPFGVRLATTLRDLAGFGPIYAIVATVALLPAFAIAGLVARRAPTLRTTLLALAGLAGLIVAMKIVDASVPPPTLIWATRNVVGLLAMTAGGALAGWLYARLTGASGR